MRVARQPVVAVLGETLALTVRRERGYWSLYDAYLDSLAIASRRFKAPAHIDHS
jgi:hypothetical protein